MKPYFVLVFAIILTLLESTTCWCGLRREAAPVIITDIEKWNHPAKKVFSKYNVPLHKVELREKKYPVFYVSLKFDPLSSQNDTFYNKFYLELLKANQWSNYTIDDDSDKLVIVISWDKGSRTLHKDFMSKINGGGSP